MTSRILASIVPLCLVIALPAAYAQEAQGDDAPAAGGPAERPEKPLVGRIENDKTYVAPSGTFRIEIPVLPELGGEITDTENVVTFQDSFSTHASIACFSMDATQRWEFETRGRKDYLTYFFANFVLPDFQQRFPGSRVESAKYRPSLMDGTLLCYTLLPGGTMFTNRLNLGTGEEPPVAKRGNLVFVKNEHVFIISIELAERVLQPSTWDKKPEEEDEILSRRMLDLLNKMSFPAPAKDSAKDAPAKDSK